MSLFRVFVTWATALVEFQLLNVLSHHKHFQHFLLVSSVNLFTLLLSQIDNSQAPIVQADPLLYNLDYYQQQQLMMTRFRCTPVMSLLQQVTAQPNQQCTEVLYQQCCPSGRLWHYGAFLHPKINMHIHPDRIDD
jgi:hypothetical protein